MFMRHNAISKITLGMLLLPLLAACAGGASDSTTSPTQPQAQVGAVQGKVMDGAGAAVSGAGLSLAAAGRSGLSTTSGSDGAYSFAQVPAGSWTLTVSAPSGFTAAQPSVALDVAAGQTASENFTLSATAPPAPQSGNAAVTIADFSFTAQSVTIAAGSTVTWKNNGQASHTASSDGAEFDSGTLGSGASFSHTFGTKGTFTYHCAFHANMTGTITVQ